MVNPPHADVSSMPHDVTVVAEGRPGTEQREGEATMDSTMFDAMAVRLGTGISRRRLLGRLAKAGAAAALAGVRPHRPPAAAGSCAYGPAPASRVTSGARPTSATKSASSRGSATRPPATTPTAGRYDPNGAYGREHLRQRLRLAGGLCGDRVCVEPWVRDQVDFDNARPPPASSPAAPWRRRPRPASWTRASDPPRIATAPAVKPGPLRARPAPVVRSGCVAVDRRL